MIELGMGANLSEVLHNNFDNFLKFSQNLGQVRDTVINVEELKNEIRIKQTEIPIYKEIHEIYSKNIQKLDFFFIEQPIKKFFN